MHYETLPEPRFAVEQVGGSEQIRVKARKQIFVLLFLPVWLTLWTMGGVTAVHQLLETGEWFLAFWLCAWAVGWVFAALTICWMIFGFETLRVVGGDLEIAQHMLRWSRRKLYPGGQVRNLQASEPPLSARFQPSFPLWGMKSGTVRFDYGARTIYAAAGLDAAEGQMIVERLNKRLPASVGRTPGP
jgi:hypothetical protein